MKHFITISIILFYAVIPVQSQNLPERSVSNEIRLSYGMITIPEISNGLASIWPSVGIKILKDTIIDSYSSMHGVITFEYNKFINKWITLGGSFGINPIGTKITTKHGADLSWNFYMLNLMPKINVYYLHHENVSLYSGIEAGLSLVVFNDHEGSSSTMNAGVSPAFHFNAFGIRLGNQIGGFIEWGVGYRGVVNLGASMKL